MTVALAYDTIAPHWSAPLLSTRFSGQMIDGASFTVIDVDAHPKLNNPLLKLRAK